MAQNASNIIRDFGTISIGGANVGYLDPVEGQIAIRFTQNKLPIRPKEKGLTLRTLHMGWQIDCRVILGQRDTAVWAAAFAGFTGSGGFTIDSSLVPGQEITGVAFDFNGRHWDIDGSNCCITIAPEFTEWGDPDRPQGIPLEVEFQEHTDGNVIVVVPA